MNEYIRKEDAFAAVDKRIENLKKDPVFIRKHGDIDLYGIKTILMVVPAADVAPVVHGKWIVVQTFEDCVYAKCSNCDVTQIFYHNKPLTKFCPDCGAKMDL